MLKICTNHLILVRLETFNLQPKVSSNQPVSYFNYFLRSSDHNTS